MIKLAFLFIGVLFLTGCWKDIAGDIVISGIGSLLSTKSDEYRKEECDKYSTTYKWENTISGKTGDMILKDNIIYSLKKSSYNQYSITEVSLSTGEIMKSLLFKKNEINEINTTSNSDIKDIIFLGNLGIEKVIVAYNILEHQVIWLNTNNNIHKEMINGFFYYKESKSNGALEENYIVKMDPITGISENIYNFPDSLNGMSLNKIEAFHSYSDNSGNLYFVYALLFKKNNGNLNLKINILNFYDNKEITIKNYYPNYNNLNENVITQDKNSIYINIEKDLYCYDKYSGYEKWSSYVSSNKARSLNSFEVVGNYLISNYYTTIDVVDKSSGENKFTKKNLYGNDRSFEIYKDYLFYSDNRYFYQLTTNGAVKSKFVSLAYCDGVHGNIFKFIIDNSGNIILNDNKYILFKSAF
jgi:hypothetical protein